MKFFKETAGEGRKGIQLLLGQTGKWSVFNLPGQLIGAGLLEAWGLTELLLHEIKEITSYQPAINESLFPPWQTNQGLICEKEREGFQVGLWGAAVKLLYSFAYNIQPSPPLRPKTAARNWSVRYK